MLNKSINGNTMRLIIWFAFSLYVCIIIYGIITDNRLLIAISVLFTLLLNGRKVVFQNIFSISKYLNFRKKQPTDTTQSHCLKYQVKFLLNPNQEKNEGLILAKKPSIIKNLNTKIRIGSNDCKEPYYCSIFNTDLTPFKGIQKQIFDNLDNSSDPGCFAILSDEIGDNWNQSEVILKVPVNLNLSTIEKENFEYKIEKLCEKPFIKAIEITINKQDKFIWSLTEFIDKKNNIFFQQYNGLLNYILKLRKICNGKPIGIRTGFSGKGEVFKLCKLMHETGIYMDFMTIVGEKTQVNSPFYYSFGKRNCYNPLEDSVAYASSVLKSYNLNKEIKIIAGGNIENGFELLKLLAIGSNGCISIKPSSYYKNIIQDYYLYGDPEDVIKSSILYARKNIITEGIKLMESAGFSSLDEIEAGKFFRRINNFGTKTLEDIYFKPGNNTGWGIFENHIHLN